MALFSRLLSVVFIGSALAVGCIWLLPPAEAETSEERAPISRKDAALSSAIKAPAESRGAALGENEQTPLFPTQIWHGAHFGYVVDVDGDTAIIGAEDDLDLQHPTDRDGAAYIFTFDGINWTQQQRLSENVTFTGYGRSVAISGDTVAVAYPGGGDEAVYVYTRTTGIWTLQQKVKPSGAINPHGFGAYVDLSGDSLIVGGVSEGVLPNRYVTTYFFQRAGGVWTQQLRTILPSGRTAISGDYALAGNPTDSSVSQFQGSVAVFRRVKGAWTQVQTLRPSDGLANGQFGSGVSIDGNTAIVGAWGRSDPNSPGSAYIFQLDGPNWVEKAKIIPPDGLPRDSFGDSVSISGDRVFVGAPSDGFTSAPGAAYLFRRDGLEWIFQEKFIAAIPGAQDLFGHSVAISGNKAVIGIPKDDHGGLSNAGSAVTVLLGANAVVKMRGPDEASLTQASIDLGLTNIDAPLIYKSNHNDLGAGPIVDKGLVADGVTPLLFDIEIPEETIAGTVDTEVVVEILYGGTIGGDAIEDRMLYLDNGSWSTSPLLTFTEIENRHFAYLRPIGSDEVQFDPGSNELEVKLQVLNKSNNVAIGTKRFYIRKPPIALVHGYNTDGTWGDDFKNQLGTSRPLGTGGDEDFVRTVRYGQVPPGAAGNTQEATILPFNVLAGKLLVEMNTMRDDLDDDWAFTRHDVVAHSQGGILSRMLTSRNGNSYVEQPFRNPQNFNRGRFHRIITIGSPHNGTRIVRYMAELREINQQAWMPVGVPNSLASVMFWSGNAQYKFDPIGAEILSINSPNTNAPWQPDADAEFHLIATTVGGGQPPGPQNVSLSDLNLGLVYGTIGETVLPRGSDGVVDFDAMIATTPSAGQTVPPNIYRIPVEQLISHAYFPLREGSSWNPPPSHDLFGGTTGQVLSDIVGQHAIRALDQSTDIPSSERIFGPFQLPGQISAPEIDAIENAAEYVSGIDDAIQFQSSHPEGRAGTVTYTYNFQLPAGEAFAAPVFWSAERYGAAGDEREGLTVTNAAGFPGRVSLTVDNSIAGDVVLRASAPAVSGKLFIGEPVLVSSTDPEAGAYSRSSISIEPASGTYEAGTGVFTVLYEHYTNIAEPGSPGLKLRRWFYDQNIQMVSTAPSVVDPSRKIEWKFPAAGTATVNVIWRGLNTSATFTIYPANGLPPTPTPSPTPVQCVTLYGASNGFNVPGNNEIYRIDPATGTVSNAVDITLAGFEIGNTNALAARPTDNVLFAVITTRNPQTRRLVTVNPNTGVATQIGVLSTNISDLAFRSDGTLWAVSGDGASTDPETLYTVDQSNGALTRQFALGNGADGETIEFHSNGLLYHSSGNVPALFESVNVDTQAITPIASGNTEMFSMGQSPVTGQLYGSDVASNLFTINIATGARTPVGHINSANDNRGLAFVPVACPAATPTPTPTPTPGVTPTPSPTPGATPLYTRGDYDGDNKTDLTVWRPSAFAAPNENLSAFYTFRSTDASFFGIQFGNTGDVAMAGDFDGDNKTDFGVSRYNTSDAGVDLVYLESSTNTAKFPVWGNSGDVFISGDYDGDKKTDVMAWRPSDGTWYIVNSSGANGGFSFIQHGQSLDKPYAMDTDGDGKSNLVYFRPQTGDWVVRNNDGSTTTTNFGLSTDIPVPADYDGDNKDDIAVFRDGLWIVLKSSNGQVEFMPFGAAGDIPVPGDYDGDNLYDRAVYREGIWHMLRSSQGYTGFQFGAATDTAMPKAYIP